MTRQSDLFHSAEQARAVERKHQAAQRQAAYRARKGRQINVILPPDLVDAFAAYMERQAMDGQALTQSEVVAKLLRQQLLRKR